MDWPSLAYVAYVLLLELVHVVRGVSVSCQEGADKQPESLGALLTVLCKAVSQTAGCFGRWCFRAARGAGLYNLGQGRPRGFSRTCIVWKHMVLSVGVELCAYSHYACWSWQSEVPLWCLRAVFFGHYRYS